MLWTLSILQPYLWFNSQKLLFRISAVSRIYTKHNWWQWGFSCTFVWHSDFCLFLMFSLRSIRWQADQSRTFHKEEEETHLWASLGHFTRRRRLTCEPIQNLSQGGEETHLSANPEPFTRKRRRRLTCEQIKNLSQGGGGDSLVSQSRTFH